MRIDKFLCHNLDLTRSEAKRAIRQQAVTCNGNTVTDAGFKPPAGCDIRFNGQTVSELGTRYLMLHKPTDMVCSNIDDGYPSVLRLLPLPKREQLVIAGRLDADTTGLLLLTDDGQWAHGITSPKRACSKRYRVQLADAVSPEAVAVFAGGVALRGEREPTRPAKLELISAHEALLTIDEGKYHQVKRMFAAIGNKVVGLHREQVGPLALDPELAAGEWRYLTAEEVDAFKRSA